MADEGRKPARRYTIVFVFACLLCLILAGISVLLVLGFSGNATSADLKAQAARTDCARAVNAQRNELLDNRDNAQARVIQALIGSLTLPVDQRAGTVAEIAELNRELDLAIAKVEALKPADVLVDERCPNG